MSARAVALVAVALLAGCASARPPARGPDHDRDLDLDLERPAHHAAPDGANPEPPPAVAARPSAPSVDAAVALLGALATDIRAALTAAHIDAQMPDLDARCHALDRTLDPLRTRAQAAAPAAGLVRQDSVRAAHLGAELPLSSLAATLDACRARYQMELPGFEGLMDDLEALSPRVD